VKRSEWECITIKNNFSNVDVESIRGGCRMNKNEIQVKEIKRSDRKERKNNKIVQTEKFKPRRSHIYHRKSN
jgi:hypothetical protein